MNIFISHTISDQETSLELKRIIAELSNNQIEIFVSSDGSSIEAGTDWLNKLFSVVKNAELTIALCSKQSIIKPWLNFEIGASWIEETPIIPICFSGLRISDLAPPLSYYNALEIENELFVEILKKSIEKHLNIECAKNLNNTQLLLNQLVKNIKHRAYDFNNSKFTVLANKDDSEYVADILCNVTEDLSRNTILKSLLAGETEIQVDETCDIQSLFETLELYNVEIKILNNNAS